MPQATLTVVEGLSAYVLEWLLQGRVDVALVYQAPPDPAIDRLPVFDEPLYLVSARSGRRGSAAVGPAVSLAEVAARELVIPSRPHSLRMQLETVLAAAGHGVELGDLVVLVVAVGVLEAVEAVVFAVFIDHDVEAVEGG